MALDYDRALAIYVFTCDIGKFYEHYNELLRTTNSSTELELQRALLGFSYFLFDGLNKLPPWTGLLLRGISLEGVNRHQVKNVYSAGRDNVIYWSSPSSATPTYAVAKGFSGGGGLILRLHMSSARDIRELSAFPNEDERLLLPNTRLAVVSDVKKDGYGVDTIELVEKTGSVVF